MAINKNKAILVASVVLFVGCVSFMTGVLVTEKTYAHKDEVDVCEDVYKFNIEDKYEEFENKQGTPISKCKDKKCDRYIATNGDTPYCEEHSNVCAICGEYISREEKICIECKEELLKDMLKSKFI